MNFSAITITDTTAKPDSNQFLQGQLTINTQKLNATPKACAICDLKGRVQFGLWVAKTDEHTFTLITHADCMADLLAHIKKYGAFSKFNTSPPKPIYPCLKGDMPSFCNTPSDDPISWCKLSIQQGNYWITPQSQHLFQPQELRLHQRGGVDYDKGCYLGQEIVARLYFKAAPKAYLHRVLFNDDTTAKLISAHLSAQPTNTVSPNLTALDLTALIGQKVGQGVIVNACIDDAHPVATHSKLQRQTLALQALVVIKPDGVSDIGTNLPIDKLTGTLARNG